jgi:hypothetical protein
MCQSGSDEANGFPYRFCSLFCDVSARVTAEPISQRIFAGNFRIDRIGIPSRDHFMKDFPDRIAIRISRRANVQHSEQSAFKHEHSTSAPLIRFWIPKWAG